MNAGSSGKGEGDRGRRNLDARVGLVPADPSGHDVPP
jgi:hypothetical protein